MEILLIEIIEYFLIGVTGGVAGLHFSEGKITILRLSSYMFFGMIGASVFGPALCIYLAWKMKACTAIKIVAAAFSKNIFDICKLTLDAIKKNVNALVKLIFKSK